VKTEEFSGLIIFKSMLIRLTNTADIEPETIVEDKKLSAIDRKILESNKKNVQNFDLWVPVKDLAHLYKLDVPELVNIIESSIEIESGKGFSFKLDQTKKKLWTGLKTPKMTIFPEKYDTFIVRFNKFLYEVSIM
jgi:DNA-binding Lrp family transcriptional regulator